MQRKTKIVIALAGFDFAVFLLILSENFLLEESVVLYLVPFLPVGSSLGVSVLVGRIRKRHVAIEGRARRLLIYCSGFHCMLIAFMLYATWPRYYGRADAVDDIEFFIKTLEDVHPNLYDRVSRNEFADSVESLKRGLAERVGENELFKDISKLGAIIQDGHTGNRYSYFMRRGNILVRRIFPYKLRVQNEKIYVVGNYSYKDDVPAGSEIIRINGLTGAEFIGQASTLLSYETIPYRNTLIVNPMFIAMWNDFKDYQIEVRLPGSVETRIVKSFGGMYARIQFLRSLAETGQPYEFKLVADSVGYIGFYQCKDLDRFKGFLKDAFQALQSKGIPHLIVDIRENGGGNSSLDDEFMQYISRKPFRMFDRIEIKVSKEVQSRYPDWTDFTNRQAGTGYESPELLLAPLRPNPLRFAGECILLTGRRTFSSASVFASAFRCSAVGVIVGAETGGITVGYGDVFDFTLPRTKFGFGVSWKRFTNACGVDNRRGVMPDYPVESSFADERDGRDRVLEFALEMAGRNDLRHGSSTF